MPSKHMDCLSNDVICKAFWVVDPSENWMKALNLYSRKMHNLWTIFLNKNLWSYTVLRKFMCS